MAQITGASPEDNLRKNLMEVFFLTLAGMGSPKNRSAGWYTRRTFISNGGYCAVTVEDLASQVSTGLRGENTAKVEGWSPTAPKGGSFLFHPGHWDFQFEK